LKAKILFVTQKFPPSIGGMETQCYELYKGLSKDYEIILYKLEKESERILWHITLKSNVKKLLGQHKDITHVYINDGLTGLAASAVKSVSSAVTIVTLHGLDVVFPNFWFQKNLKSNHNSNVDYSIPVSHATKNELINRGVNSERITVVPNGVDLALCEIPQQDSFLQDFSKRYNIDITKKKLIISIGRSVRRKGFSWFLKNIVPDLDDDSLYCIIGPIQKKLMFYRILKFVLPGFLFRQIELGGIGLDQIEINKLLKDPNIASKAVQLGKVSHNDKIQLLKHAHVFVMPNIRVFGDAEGFGLVALEAVMCGAPVIVSGIEGITEAIHDGKNGVIVDSESTHQWKKALKEVTVDQKRRKNESENRINYTIDKFSWNKMVDQYKRIIESSTSRPK
jgi:glycosyltransferase involved in cell wall biosynthesis